MKKAIAVGVVLLVGATAAQAQVTCESTMVPMRDGTRLYTEIYKPPAPGAYPVIIARSPYGRLFGDGCFHGIFALGAAAWAQKGYVSILQEVRGTMSSEGKFTPFFQEQHDGYDAVEWAAAEPWSNGKVGLTSGSYLGVTQWQAALTAPPHLLAFTPAITASDYHDDWVFRNGVPDLAFGQLWGEFFIGDALTRALQAQGATPDRVNQEVAAWYALQAKNGLWFSALPLAGSWGDTEIGTSGLTIRQMAPQIWDWYAHPTYDSYWAKVDVEQHWDDVQVPALVSGGWYDLFAVGTVNNYMGMHAEGGTRMARAGSMLVMDCCGHGLANKFPGQVTWGNNHTDPTLTSRFLDHYVKGIDNGVENEPRVQLTVLIPPDAGTAGNNFLFKTTDYPVPGTRHQRYELRSGGHANTLNGDGVLLASSEEDDEGERESGASADRFTYDPLHPVPTVGGNDANAAFDQTSVEQRDDVLVYTSAALTNDMAVIGRVNVKFWAKTSAQDTDFTAKLVDVHPDGYAHDVVDRIVRARYRRGSKWPAQLVKPNKAYEYRMLLGDTATIFKKGHKIRLEISSSNFPHYARNLNTGKSNEQTAETMVAHQTILHDEEHSSFLELPIVAGVAAP